MKLLIIHLSDIHLKSHDNSILKKTNKLVDAIQNSAKENDAVLLVISGDIAFSGRSEEYKVAESFLTELIEQIESYSQNKIDALFVPGNHDCYLGKEKNELRELLIDNLRGATDSKFTDQLVKSACEPQDEFFNFSKEWGIPEPKSRLFSSISKEYGEVKIDFLCYNTGWFSILHEQPGKMRFPISKFDFDSYDNSNIKISLLHHPLNWQTPEDARELKNHLEKTSDMVLSGHEHSKSKGVYSNLEGNHTYYIEAGALQDSHNRSISEFNLIHLDFGKQLLKIDSASWKEGLYRINSGDWSVLKRGDNLHAEDITLKESFKVEILENVGAQYDHPRKEDLVLADFFIPLNIKEVSTSSIGAGKQRIIDTDSLFSFPFNEDLKVLLLGGERSGKSAILKWYYSKLYDQGMIPILCNTDKIQGTSVEEIKKWIEQAFNQQYDTSDISLFRQLDSSNILLLVDDYHTFKPSQDVKKNFIKNLMNLYPNLILTGNKLISQEDITDSEGNNIYEEFSQYNILRLGPSLRDAIINKWNSLNQDGYVERNDILKQNDECSKFINDIVKKSLIPAYPFFILTMLQSQSSQEQNPEYSVHGYYYQLLINKALMDATDKPNNIGAYHNFISEYCFFLFSEKIKLADLSEIDFDKIFQKFCTDYDVTTISLTTLKDVLVKSEVLIIKSGLVSLKYRYIYYFYVAKYFTDNISQEEIKGKIRKMCRRVYREEYSQIIMFLVHLEKSDLIIDELVNNSRLLFKDEEPIKLNGDIDFLDELIDKLPEHTLEAINVENNRVNQTKEDNEREKKELKTSEIDLRQAYDLDEDITNLDFLSRMNRALRTIELLGQVTKKHWGEIKGEKKLELAEETFLLGLRTLGFYYRLLNSNVPLLVDHIIDIIEDKNIRDSISKSELMRITNMFIFRLGSASAFGILKKISNAIGLEDLDATFSKVKEKNNHLSVELANLSIKLDHYKAFPEREIIKFKEDNSKSYICIHILQQLVLNHFYLFHMNPKKLKEYCQKLDIKFDQPLLAQYTSVEKRSKK